MLLKDNFRQQKTHLITSNIFKYINFYNSFLCEITKLRMNIKCGEKNKHFMDNWTQSEILSLSSTHLTD